MDSASLHLPLSNTERALIDRLYAEDQDQRRRGLPTATRTRNINLNTGAFLWQTVVATRPRRILEIGSSNGLSTVFLASAARRIGARVLGTEVLLERANANNAQLAEVGLGDVATVIARDHREFPEVEEETWDLVFIDAEKDDYLAHLQAIESSLAPGAIVLADNVISHDCSVYQSYVRSSDAYSTTTVTQDRGIEMSIFRP